MRLEWTKFAIKDLADAREFIVLFNPRAASKMSERVKEAVEYLLEYPNIGRNGRVTGTKELVVSGTPFIVIYRIKIPSIQILRVLHHSRKWPAM